jgi:hypothetical protein
MDSLAPALRLVVDDHLAALTETDTQEEALRREILAAIMENQPLLDQLRRVRFRWRVRPERECPGRARLHGMDSCPA